MHPYSLTLHSHKLSTKLLYIYERTSFALFTINYILDWGLVLNLLVGLCLHTRCYYVSVTTHAISLSFLRLVVSLLHTFAQYMLHKNIVQRNASIYMETTLYIMQCLYQTQAKKTFSDQRLGKSWWGSNTDK